MQINEKLQDPLIDQLAQAVLTLKTEEDCYRFFFFFSTISEIKALGQRLEVARMLQEKQTYDEIAGQTGASTATISRVKRCLNYGADGYKIVLERMKKDKIKQKK